MEQEIVGGGNERRGRGKMCVERPKRLDLEEDRRGVRQHVNRGNGDTHGGEGGDFFDSLFVIGDLVPWCPLLAEPKYPTEIHSTRPRNQHIKEVNDRRDKGVRVSEGVHSCR